MSAEIIKVEKGSIAEEIGLEIGDKILSVNGEKFTDALEYRFLISEEYIELEIETKDNENVICEIEKEEYEDLGVEFENPLIDKPRSCRNKCIFCSYISNILIAEKIFKHLSVSFIGKVESTIRVDFNSDKFILHSVCFTDKCTAMDFICLS